MKAYIFALCVCILFLASCNTTQLTLAPIPTPTIEPTSTSTSIPIPTNTAESTLTPVPSPTLTVLPDAISQAFSSISIIQHDSFQYTMDQTLPAGWTCLEQGAARVTQDNQFKIQPADAGKAWNGTILYYSEEPITPNMGVYFVFKYTGNQQMFTLGLDAVDRNGQWIPLNQKDGHSIAMQMADQLTAHIMTGSYRGDGYFKGNLRLHEDAWYDIALGFDDKGNYIIKIWDTLVPEKQLTYIRNIPNFPTRYYFISWIGAKRSLLIDDFTIFTFDSIVAK